MKKFEINGIEIEAGSIITAIGWYLENTTDSLENINEVFIIQ